MRPYGFDDFALLAGRLLIAPLFIYDAGQFVRLPTDTAAYMSQFGVPSVLLYPVALIEAGGGLLVAAGLMSRPAALALAGFCLLTAAIFHHDFANPGEIVQFGKDCGLAGGFLMLSARGSGRLSVDEALGRRRAGEKSAPVGQRRVAGRL